MNIKLNFESEEELIEYLKSNLTFDIDRGYYGDGELNVMLGANILATKYIRGSN